MSSLDYRTSIDIINEISNTLFDELLTKKIIIRDNIVVIDDFSVDIQKYRKYYYRISVKDSGLRKILDVIIDKKCIHIKFSTEFIISIDNVDRDELSTNLFEKRFSTDELDTIFSTELNIAQQFDYSSEKLKDLIFNTVRIYHNIEW